jgi:hypothetical protein
VNTYLKNPNGSFFSFQSKDRRDVSGKKCYRVNIPTRLIMYISIIFVVVPLFVGLILLILALIDMHTQVQTDVSVGGGINHHIVTLILENRVLK